MMSSHIAPRSLYFTIFGALMVLTAITVAITYVDLGAASLPAAMLIAVFKATLVVLFFMHVRWSGRLVQVTVMTALVFLGILFFHTLSDYLTRGWLGVGGK